MLDFVLKLGSLLPLPVLHGLGGALGTLAYWIGKEYRQKLHENLKNAGFDDEKLAPEVRRQLGMQAIETAWVWKRSNKSVVDHIIGDEVGLAQMRAALDAGKSLVFMTPHIGCFEVTPLWIYEACLKHYEKPLTVLYREPKLDFLKDIVARGRLREGMDPAPADLSGVRKIVRAMRAGGALGCLPDQVPGRGEGVWVPFFGRLAYTMTFPMKMAKQFNAAKFMVWSERIPGKGWKVFVREWTGELTGDAHQDAMAMNREIEALIRKVPTQFIWNYNRFKRPSGAPAPTAEEKKLLEHQGEASHV